MIEYHKSRLAAIFHGFFLAFSMFLFLLFICNISLALTTIDLTKKGKDYLMIERGELNNNVKVFTNNNIKLHGSAVSYFWNLTPEYINYLDSMSLDVNVVSTDDAACNEDGDDWSKVYVMGNDWNWHNMGSLNATGVNNKPLQGTNWQPFNYNREYNAYYVWIKIQAPKCTGAARDADIEISELKLKLKVHSKAELSKTSIDFGNLYYPRYKKSGTVNSGDVNDTAVKYNESMSRTIRIKNIGYGNLSWGIKSKPAGLTVSPESGTLSRNSESTITLKLGSPPGTSSSYSESVVFDTDDEDPDNESFSVSATLYDTPIINHIPPATGWKSNTVHIAVDDPDAVFEVTEADPFFPGPGGGDLPVKRYEWQSVQQNANPASDGWRAGERIVTGTQLKWSAPGSYDLHCRMVDDNGVATRPVKIPVRIWGRPTVSASPPDPSSVDWFGWVENSKNQYAYVGTVNQPVKFQAGGSVHADNNDSSESIGIYNWYDMDGNLLFTQSPDSVAEHTWDTRNLNARIYCKAITNFDIMSHSSSSKGREFRLKIYPNLQVSATELGAPDKYVGRAMDDVIFDGWLNQNDYPSIRSVSMQWHVDSDGDGQLDTTLEADSNGRTKYKWTASASDIAEYVIMFEVSLTTIEGMILTGTDYTTVMIDAAMPKAYPGGPYRGGITGGNFSPIQFAGNHPDFVESEEIGSIVDWVWSFKGAGNPCRALGFDGVSSYVNIPGHKGVTGKAPRTVAAWIGTPMGDYPIASWGQNTTGEKWVFRVQTTDGTPGAIRVEVNGGYVVGSTVVADGKWHHVAAVLPDKTSPDAIDILLYVDGQLEPLSASKGMAIDTASDSDITIGTDVNGRYFLGVIDEVAIWERALSEEEIGNLLEFGPMYNVSGLVGYWPFNEGTGSVALDVSIFEKNGVINGVLMWVDGRIPREPKVVSGIWNPNMEYPQAGIYDASLIVKSHRGRWSPVSKTTVTVIDGRIEGYVKAADLRTPVGKVKLTLSSSHVDPGALELVANNDPNVYTSGGGNIWTETNDKGFYRFDHLPLGSYNVTASKMEGNCLHEFERTVQNTELTLDAPKQLAMDFVDISVYPISGRILYEIKKDGSDVFVSGATIVAQAAGAAGSIESLPSSKPPAGAQTTNYSLPLFAGQYLFIARLEGHDIRINEKSPGYDSSTQLVTIEKAESSIDFIDRTRRTVNIVLEDSGGNPITNYPEYLDSDQGPISVDVTGENGHVGGEFGLQDSDPGPQSIFTAMVPPGKYTVTVPGAKPETRDVDVTSEDQSVTMTIPVMIELSIEPKPKLFDVPNEFLEMFGLTPDQNPEGYMYYYPPEPRTHRYTVKATANGNPVAKFKLFITDEVSMETSEPPEENAFTVDDDMAEYIMTAGLPRMDPTVEPPVAAPKRITFRAEKESYLDSVLYEDSVIVLGDVSIGSAQRIVSVPVVNYTVLHDPPGDGSYSYLDDSLKLKGIVSGMTITVGNDEIPVYPSPWRDERKIAGFSFEKGPGTDTEYSDLGDKGLMDSDRTITPPAAAFTLAATAEAVTAGINFLVGPFAFIVQVAKIPILGASLEAGSAIPGVTGVVQYEVSPSRHIETPSGDDIPDIMGPGKGDIYFGEGWTLGLQQKYRLGVKLENGVWKLETDEIMTYDILERTNQYIYTTRDIENIIKDLGAAIEKATDEKEKEKLKNAQTTWKELLNKNLAYIFQRDYVSNGLTYEDFVGDNPVDEEASGRPENLIFSGGPTFEYSRSISEGITTKVSVKVSVESTAELMNEMEVKSGFELYGSGITFDLKQGGGGSVGSATEYGAEWEGGKGAEQSVGFVLNDDDVGDNISTRVHADPVWGTPIFFQDAGSITSDPWEPGTNKGIDIALSLVEEPTEGGVFDYEDGAYYKVRVDYTGIRNLDTFKFDFEIFAPPTENKNNAYVEFNENWAPYSIRLDQENPSAIIGVYISPSEGDLGSSEEKQYSVGITVWSTNDGQISQSLTLKPRFADLRAPRAVIDSPYSGQRISPVLFPDVDPFDIKVVSEDTDLASVQLQIRAKQINGVWEPWQNLPGMMWKEGETTSNVTVFQRTDCVPPRYEFTFKWTDKDIKALGVGEYAIRAVATDKATKPNTDIDPPFVVFTVDDSKPSVLTTIPNYQDRDSQRIYRGELSVVFTDDMRATDFGDRTFYVTDLLAGEKVAGFVSYSLALRKAIFVPQVPFKPNGFYRAEIKTDTIKDGKLEPGVHDLAGNPLDSAFMWTFRTTEAPFEPTWSITLSVTGCESRDGNNIAGVEYGALDGEDEKDAKSVPTLASRLRLNFLNHGKMEFDRDIHPADGRLSHHWFFAVVNVADCSPVTIRWKPSSYLLRPERQYQIIRLVQFDDTGNVTNAIVLDPTTATIDPATGEIQESEAYTYDSAGETTTYFRLDVMKADLVATVFTKGSSEWKFFSVPIIPQVADPFVNLGDDIDPLQVFWYDTALDGYKVYPLDLGAVSLVTGRGYFTRLESDVEVDIGGASNLQEVTVTLEDAGWHAIGNPFIKPVMLADLRFSNGSQSDLPFADAVKSDGSNLLEPTLYHWTAGSGLDKYEPVTDGSELLPWEGYWIRTKQPNITITIPAPADIANAEVALPPSFQPPMMAPPANQKSLIASPDFSVRLELSSDSASDIYTALGTRNNAQAGWDGLDQSEPPTLGQTVAAYFDHSDWGVNSGLYNTDYQPTLAVGEERIWKFTIFTDKPQSELRLSWENSVYDVPGDIMLYYRACEKTGLEDSVMDLEWHDMREVPNTTVKSRTLITKLTYEVKAQRFFASPPSEVQVIPGEKEITLRWKADSNDLITGYTITRQDGPLAQWKEGEGKRHVLHQSPGNPISQFVDNEVQEEVDYTYQISVRFKSGLELVSGLFAVRVLPFIKQTALMQSYPNPFNPEVWIPYELAEQVGVSIHIYDSSGRLIRILDLGTQDRGRYASRAKAAYWDGCNQTGEHVASGVYFYVMRAGDFTAAKKMILLR